MFVVIVEDNQGNIRYKEEFEKVEYARANFEQIKPPTGGKSLLTIVMSAKE